MDLLWLEVTIYNVNLMECGNFLQIVVVNIYIALYFLYQNNFLF